MTQALKVLPCCPECGSVDPYRAGFYYPERGDPQQRYQCRECSIRYRSEPNTLKTKLDISKSNQIGVFRQDMKNLVPETTIQNVSGESQKTKETKGKIVEYLWHLKKEGRRPQTIYGRRKVLRRLYKRGADLFNPESVKEVIANENVAVNTKIHYVSAYDGFAKWLGIQWRAPKYRPIQKLPFIPTETEIDQLIAGLKPKKATFCQILKETMARCGEAWALKWIDLNGNILTINDPEKGSLPRQFKISEKLVSMLSILPKEDDRIFGPTTDLNNFRGSYIKRRKRIARTLGTPRINKITFHTFRHFGATMLYAKTKNLIYVQEKLGHRNIQNTMVYTHLINFESDEYHSQHAKTLAEEDKLIEAGFEFVRYDNREDVAIYRKRK